MINFKKTNLEDVHLLSEISKQSFIASHGHSASIEDIEQYIKQNFSIEILQNEIKDTNTIFHFIYDNTTVAGYSKIVLDEDLPILNKQKVTKLSRLYLLPEYKGKGIGLPLLDFNIQFSKNKKQQGMWLFVWKENHGAVNFYLKNNFKIVGSYDFKISETHTNPNHVMSLTF